MSSKCRTIDPQLFQKAEFRRATYVQREVWMGIIATCCDDEGRFEADPWNLSELIFSRAHDATEEAVAGALEYWRNTGWLTLYDDGRYGFLTGWYEHQYIKTPEPSSYPPPPEHVNSWRVVKQLKAWYMQERGGKENTHFRTVLREFEQSLLTDESLSANLLQTKCEHGEDQNGREGERKGTEGKGKEDAPAPPPVSTSTKQRHPDYSMILSNHQTLRAALEGQFKLHWTQEQLSDFAVDAGDALDQPGAQSLPEADVVAMVKRGENLPPPGDRGDWWVGRLVKDLQRQQSRASPRSAAAVETDRSKFAPKEDVA